MKLKKVFILFSMFLMACSAGQKSQFYVLNPIAYHKNFSNQYSYLHLGINEIDCPSYLCKPDIIIHQSPNHVDLKDFHQWAGAIQANLKRVVEANLSLLLPGAAVVNFPWPAGFNPNYELQLDLIQFDNDIRGCSNLRVNYFIYSQQKLVSKGSLYYQIQIQKPYTMERFVFAMNKNLERLTRFLATKLASLPKVTEKNQSLTN